MGRQGEERRLVRHRVSRRAERLHRRVSGGRYRRWLHRAAQRLPHGLTRIWGLVSCAAPRRLIRSVPMGIGLAFSCFFRLLFGKRLPAAAAEYLPEEVKPKQLAERVVERVV